VRRIAIVAAVLGFAIPMTVTTTIEHAIHTSHRAPSDLRRVRRADYWRFPSRWTALDIGAGAANSPVAPAPVSAISPTTTTTTAPPPTITTTPAPVAVPTPTALPPAAPTGDLLTAEPATVQAMFACIRAAESRTTPTVVNSTSGDSGLYQFSVTTWQANGGGQFTSEAQYASRAEQDDVAVWTWQADGWSPWASDGCVG